MSQFVLTQTASEVQSAINKALSSPPSRGNPSAPIPPGIVMDLFECAMTYYNMRNSFEFTYSGKGTMYDDDFVFESPMADCSSLMQAWITGVPYHTSKYANNSDNIPYYGYGITLPDNPYNSEKPARYYANELARYFYEQGYCFIPNSDCSNIMPGDIIFMSFANKAGNEFHENAFMKIDHCSLVVGYKDRTHLTCLHTTLDQTISFYDVRVKESAVDPNSANQYNDSVVLVARLPFAYGEAKGGSLVASTKDHFTSTSEANGLLCTMPIEGGLKADTPYTLVTYVDNAFQHGDDSVVASNYVGVRGVNSDEASGVNYTISSWMYNSAPKSNVYYFNFIVGSSDVGVWIPDILKIYVLNNTVKGHVFKGAYLYEGFVRPSVNFDDVSGV